MQYFLLHAFECDTQEALDGYRRAVVEEGNNPEEVRKRAMANPEVQAILADPAMQMILDQMSKDPKAVRECVIKIAVVVGVAVVVIVLVAVFVRIGT